MSKIVYEKDVDEPIAHYLKGDEILRDRHGLEKTKKPGANVQQTIIKFPKKTLTVRLRLTAPLQ